MSKDDVEIPSLTLDQDELIGHIERAPNRSKRPKTGKDRLNPPPARPDSLHRLEQTNSVKKTSLLGVYFLMFLLTGSAVGGGYWLWLENQALRNELLGARSQIQDLDHQLVAADASTNKLGATVEETLAQHDSEIRKLWGVAYDTNRKAIAANKESLGLLEGKLSQLRETVSTQAKLVAIQGDAFSEVEDGYNRLLGLVTQTEATQQQQKNALGTLEQTVSDLGVEQSDRAEAQKKRVAALEKQLAQLEKMVKRVGNRLDGQGKDIQALSATPSVPSDMEARVQNAEEAIHSIDEFRPQVLREINSIKAQVRQLALQQSLNAGG